MAFCFADTASGDEHISHTSTRARGEGRRGAFLPSLLTDGGNVTEGSITGTTKRGPNKGGGKRGMGAGRRFWHGLGGPAARNFAQGKKKELKGRHK